MSRARTVVPVVTFLLSVAGGMVAVASDAAAAAPTVTGVSPASGPAAGGNVVAIRGNGVSMVTKVSFGSSTSTKVKSEGANLILVTAPKHAAGRVDVRVTSRNGTSATSADDLYYYASAAPKLSWTKAVPIVKGTPAQDPIGDVSCAAQDHCVAIGEHGRAYTWNGHYMSYVTADATTDAPKMVYNSISCPTTTFCVAVGYYDPYPSTGTETSKAVVLTGTTWSAPVDLPDPDVEDVSCASPQMCVALTVRSSAAVYRNGTWARTPQIPPGTDRLDSLSCPSANFCIAVEPYHGLYTTYNGSTWTEPAFTDEAGDGSGLYSVDCALPTYCTAVTGSMHPVFRRGTTWGMAPQGTSGSGLGGNVSCPTTRFCVATTDHDVTSPSGTIAFDGAAVAQTPAPIVPQAPALRVSCGSDQQCVVISAGGQISLGRRIG